MGQLCPQALDLRKVVDKDVRQVRMAGGVILMIFLLPIERLQRRHFRHDRARKYLGRLQLIDVGLTNASLFFGGEEDDRSVLRTLVWSLPIELSGVVSDGKEDLQELTIRNLRRVVHNLD